MRKLFILAAAAAITAGCDRGETYEAGGEVDTMDTTAAIGIPNYDVDLIRDTVNVPTLGTEKDTLIVDKPVISGRKGVEVKRPTVRRDSTY